ncbi:acyl carrier protein [Kibdelosporangium phytohabitans]|uniref:Phosphopantetheine-binding protein n=1 Tax=Kibdelosporangium phytohabitans TaxID=860235 RepID=A0A0N9HYE6_9PSEU|nr:acyl carrier protein [Kibdelosporangium phytohabitans]ALG08681.1 phosphopantetheine-binding protein [Kibdelosporangium phytohabitans]MBE1470214.1 acyl carrier protein [Kibdelosporangium phytohabitans]
MTVQNEKPAVAADVATEIREILVSAAGLDPSAFDGDENDSLADLGLDSLATMELQAIVQTRHQVRIPDESLAMSVPEIAAYVRDGLAERV